MKVRTLLLVALIAALLVMGVLFFTVWTVSRQVERQANTQRHTAEITSQVSALLVLTNEYALHGEVRVVEQWRAIQKKIVIGLETQEQSANQAPTEALEQARVMSLTFDQLVAPERKRDTPLEARRTDLLINQLLTQTQTFFDTVDRWGDAASANRLQLENRFKLIFYVTVITMMLIVLVLVALLWYRVLQPLSALHGTVRALNAGDLEARCNIHSSDEFGDLSRSFNAMVDARQQTEAELRDGKNFMTLLTDVLPGMVGYWTKELSCKFANTGYKSWFGKSKDEVLGMRMQDLLGEELFCRNEPFIRGALRGEAQHFERSITKPDGTVGYGLAHYLPDTEGQHVKGFFVLFSDVTEIKVAQQAALAAEQFARTTIDTMPETICVLDNTGVIIAVNQSWRNFYDANFDSAQSVNYALGTNYLQVCELATGPKCDGGSADGAGPGSSAKR